MLFPGLLDLGQPDVKIESRSKSLDARNWSYAVNVHGNG